jgi:hypothetical protein
MPQSTFGDSRHIHTPHSNTQTYSGTQSVLYATALIALCLWYRARATGSVGSSSLGTCLIECVLHAHKLVEIAEAHEAREVTMYQVVVAVVVVIAVY